MQRTEAEETMRRRAKWDAKRGPPALTVTGDGLAIEELITAVEALKRRGPMAGAAVVDAIAKYAKGKHTRDEIDAAFRGPGILLVPVDHRGERNGDAYGIRAG